MKWLVIALLALPVLAHAEDSEHDRLAKGEVLITTTPIPGNDLPEVTVRAVIDAAPERVWAIIDQCGRYKETMFHIKESQELSRVGNTVRCQVTIGTPAPFRDLTSVTVAEHTIVPGKSWIRTWRLESGDYKENTGSWTLIPFDGNPNRTLAQYRVLSEPKIWLPTWIEKYAMEKGLPGLIDKLRSELH